MTTVRLSKQVVSNHMNLPCDVMLFATSCRAEHLGRSGHEAE